MFSKLIWWVDEKKLSKQRRKISSFFVVLSVDLMICCLLYGDSNSWKTDAWTPHQFFFNVSMFQSNTSDALILSILRIISIPIFTLIAIFFGVPESRKKRTHLTTGKKINELPLLADDELRRKEVAFFTEKEKEAYRTFLPFQTNLLSSRKKRGIESQESLDCLHLCGDHNLSNSYRHQNCSLRF